MFDKIKLLLAALAVAMLTGCGHNLGSVMYGGYANIGYDPEFNKFGIQYVDGLMMAGLNKELSKNGLKFTDSVEKDGVRKTIIIEYVGENGAQVTGYQVDLEKARQAKANDNE